MSDTPEAAGDGVRKLRSRKRFERKREEILDAAAELINSHGVMATTLQEVARAVDLNTTSVTYYFRRKEQLAAAVFGRTMERLQAITQEAARLPDPRSRVSRFIARHFELRAGYLRGTERPFATLSDLRTLDDASRIPLQLRYQQLFRDVRAFWGPPHDAQHKQLLTARAHVLLENMFWLPVWIDRYPMDEFERVARRMFEILDHGIARPGASWHPAMLPEKGLAEDTEDQAGTLNFMRAATRLINESGYRGASVLRIVEALNVTKGSFYHYLDAKEDLVQECFRQSYRRVADIQIQANLQGGDEWQRISTAIASLLDIQFEGSWPLTRTSAFAALPDDVRAEVVKRSDRTALRFAGSLMEGASEGSLRLVDPMVASQIIICTINAAVEMRNWASRMPREQAIALYATTATSGLFGDRAGRE